MIVRVRVDAKVVLKCRTFSRVLTQYNGHDGRFVLVMSTQNLIQHASKKVEIFKVL